MEQKIIVIGGGAAGMMAAGIAAQKGLEVHLLERNDKLGKKIFITGKGRCNFTNSGDIDSLIENIMRNPYFLYSALYTFSNNDLIDFFHGLGVRSKIERGNRVFPQSDKSSDIIKALSNFINSVNVNIHLNQRVKEILVHNKKIKGVILENGEKINASKVILATGGLSYPKTGSTGDGFYMAKKLGHNIIKPSPSLVPMVVDQDWIRELQGLSLRNVEVNLIKKDKIVKTAFGEMVFTHYGVSGPIILSLSACMEQPYSNYFLSLNLKPALTEQQLDLRMQKDFEKYSKKQYKNSLQDILPRKMIPILIRRSEIDGEKFVNQITKEERKKLVKLMQNFTLPIKTLRPIDEAIVTSGGIDTKEINSSTMESKLIEGLYFAGEIIDVDALTGGYNLQIAFSTGYLAGLNS
ncbi:NAD(P)/FAD-dependent oxidoreductase [Irregularibacter muris]|uniref:NAD(P)/FAD-dependent oxidoreductase n=1 Tax=Irregularibacter muris TaxID=1796619 RepID=A0AAE3HEQ8_9FIRM|nr:NAD(P)/FAD-dependent oxidoreductase [Irregularibacter muris]MCR1898059.1 NAD(P)/FAD-dependent oxidoreductase [Irregularibacter muris]